MRAVVKEQRCSAPDNAIAREFRSGWRILVPSFFSYAFAMGQISTISIGSFVIPVSEDMGWSRTEVQASLIFGQGFSTIGVIIAGMLLDRIGMRWAAIIGLFGTAAGLALISLSQSLIYFYFIFALTAVVGAGASALTFSRAVTQAFDKHLGLALAIVMSGAGMSWMLLPSIIVRVIGEYGWRAGYIALASFPAFLALPAVLWLFWPREPTASATGEPRKAVDAPPKFKDVVSGYRFWVILVSIFCTYCSLTAILPNFISALVDAGMSAERAAAAQGVFGISMLSARLAIGFLVDRFWAPAVGALIAVPATIGSLLMTFDPSIGNAILAAALIGIALGAEIDLLAFFVSRYFRPNYFPKAYSYIYSAAACAGAVSPMTFAWLRQVTGTYHPGFYVAAGLFVLGGGILLTLGRYQNGREAPPA